jgi:5-methylcytosine-specific restriction endonuclease McrA
MVNYTEEELEIFLEFDDRCARCGQPSIVLHEIVPKSKRPKTWNTKDNRIPLCNDCHLLAHAKGTRNSKDELQSLRYTSKYRRATNKESL